MNQLHSPFRPLFPNVLKHRIMGNKIMDTTTNKVPRYFMILCAMILWTNSASAQPTRHQVTGLFSTDREQDLREAFQKIPQIKLISIDFKNAEATLEYAAFPNTKPDQVVPKLD